MLPLISAGPLVYPTVLARYARFIPDLMPRVMKMRQAENKKLAQKQAENPLPHIPHALKNVPSEDLATQNRIQNKMRTALDDMHRQIVDDIAAFIDNKLKDIGWLTSPVNIDYIASDISKCTVLAYDKDQLLALIKLLTFFAVTINKGSVPTELVGKVQGWYNEALPLLEEIKVGKRSFKLFDPAAQGLKRAGKVRLPQHIRDVMKNARAVLRDKTVERNIARSPEYTKRLKDMLNKLYSYFFSYSEPAYNFLVQNIHTLGDRDLNSLMEPEFNGNPKAEADKLARMVVKHGGSGHMLDKDASKELMERNPDAHKAYRQQSTLVRDASRIVVKRAIRASGQELMRARDVAKILQDAGLPSTGHFIPKGFDPGYYDQDMNMYSPKKEQLETNIAGNGWINWHSAGAGLKSIGKYQTPMMQEPARLYTLKHSTGARQTKKYGDVEVNKTNLGQLTARWVADSKSRDPEKQLLGQMAIAMYYLSMRVGSPYGSTDDEQTFGLTTFQVGHVKRRGEDLIFDFRGKSGMSQALKLSPSNEPRRNLIAFVLKKMAGKSRRDPLWTYGPNNHAPSAARVNKYLKNTGWSGSAKTMRTLRGTVLMERELENVPSRFNSPKNAVDWMINTLTKVGEALGHKRTDTTGQELTTWRTAATSYVNPKLIVEFFHQHGVHPLPNWIAKFDKR